ncbi:MAG: hypothetical protein DRH12_01365 [Deltaproteobacteria bacterium]|nr:MAG: hypothetical protein DRH12_01365 [Deltaproteobacteria bacterium]
MGFFRILPVPLGFIPQVRQPLLKACSFALARRSRKRCHQPAFFFCLAEFFILLILVFPI